MLPNNAKILQNMSQISIRNALNPVSKQSLMPIMKLRDISQELTNEIDSQWKKLHLMSWKEHKDTLVFWGEVAACKDASGIPHFKELAEFAISLLVSPHSHAEVERVFSQMNLVKNKVRNRMQSEMANAILAIRA